MTSLCRHLSPTPVAQQHGKLKTNWVMPADGCVHTADATQLDSWVATASAVCTGLSITDNRRRFIGWRCVIGRSVSCCTFIFPHHVDDSVPYALNNRQTYKYSSHTDETKLLWMWVNTGWLWRNVGRAYHLGRHYYRIARCTIVQSAVLPSHVVHLSVRPSVTVTLVDCDH